MSNSTLADRVVRRETSTSDTVIIIPEAEGELFGKRGVICATGGES